MVSSVVMQWDPRGRFLATTAYRLPLKGLKLVFHSMKVTSHTMPIPDPSYIPIQVRLRIQGCLQDAFPGPLWIWK